MVYDAVTHIKQLISPIDLLQHYHVNNISDRGADVRCSCPIHRGNNPTAFVINKENKLWFCHTKCNTGGDIFDLVMQIEGIDFMQAVNRIAELFNIDIANMEVKARTNKALQDTKQWIQTMRGIVDSKVNNVFDISMLGDLYNINLYRNFDRKTLDNFNVKYCKNNARIIIPIYENKQLIGVTMRRTKPHPAKWLHQPTGLKTSSILYNYDNTINGEPLIICEGPFDVFNLWQKGYENVVATFGCHMTQAQEKLVLLKTYDVMMAYDNDKAGMNGTKLIIDSLQKKVNMKVINIKEQGLDPGQLSNEQLYEALNNAYKAYEWKNVV